MEVLSAGPLSPASTVTFQNKELWFPLADWSDDDVFTYLRSVGAPVARNYTECGTKGPEWPAARFFRPPL